MFEVSLVGNHVAWAIISRVHSTGGYLCMRCRGNPFFSLLIIDHRVCVGCVGLQAVWRMVKLLHFAGLGLLSSSLSPSFLR